MRTRLLSLALAPAMLAVTLLISWSRPADALQYGREEKLVKIGETRLQAPEGQLFVCHKKKTFVMGAGYFMTGEIVLCDGSLRRWRPLPQGAELAELQKAGLLPEPLPSYDFTFWDYVAGFGFWIFAAMVGFVSFFTIWRERSPGKS